MAVLSLQEAAERTETSKVDMWRAIQAGRLLAQRTDDGGFAIDPAELFRVLGIVAAVAKGRRPKPFSEAVILDHGVGGKRTLGSVKSIAMRAKNAVWRACGTDWPCSPLYANAALRVH
jgi:hypothetical protein